MNNEVMKAVMQAKHSLSQFEMPFFEEAWKNIIRKNIGKNIKVKQNCVKNLVFASRDEIFRKALERKIPLNPNTMATLIGKITEYAFNYSRFYLSHLPEDKRAKVQVSEDFKNIAIINISETFLSNEFYRHDIPTETALTSPEILSFNMFVEMLLFAHGSIERSLYVGKENKVGFLSGLLQIALLTIKSINQLICEGLDINAIVLWRNLHEIECTIAILNDCDSSVVDRYYTQQGYFRLEYEQDEKTIAQLKTQLKKEMEEHGLKDSQKRDYINYGWLLYIDEFREAYKDPKNKLKLNFKSGVQRFAGHEESYDRYAMASKFTHSTGALLNIHPQRAYQFVIDSLTATIKNIATEFQIWAEDSELIDKEERQVLAGKIKQYFQSFDDNLKVVKQKCE